MSRALTFILAAGLAGLTAVGIAACGGSGSPTSPTPPPNGGNPPPAAAPTVTGISPATGAIAGGTTVTITGTNFAAGAAVTIGGAAATEVAVASATSITAKTPARTTGAGSADVAVTVNGRTGSLPNGFAYTNASAPSTSVNEPPVIGARMRVRGTRPGIPFNFADLGETINITAEVSDEETPLEQLVYEWHATGGTIIGSGPAVQYRAPDSGVREYTIELTVKERYTGTGPNGQPAPMEHVVKGTTFVNVHDSVQEIREMARAFLLDFSLQRPADVILRNFTVSAGCPRGRAKEAADVEQNQRENVIKEHFVGDPEITVAFAGVCRFAGELGDACAYVPVRWNSLYKGTEMRVAEGTDQVTAMYEGNRWWICDSHFVPKGTNGTVRSWFKQ